jgi:hypothetical protein
VTKVKKMKRTSRRVKNRQDEAARVVLAKIEKAPIRADLDSKIQTIKIKPRETAVIMLKYKRIKLMIRQRAKAKN